MANFVRIGSRVLNVDMITSFRLFEEGGVDVLAISYGMANLFRLRGAMAPQIYSRLIAIAQPLDWGTDVELESMKDIMAESEAARGKS